MLVDLLRWSCPPGSNWLADSTRLTARLLDACGCAVALVDELGTTFHGVWGLDPATLERTGERSAAIARSGRSQGGARLRVADDAALAVRAGAGIFAGAPVRVSGRNVGALVVIRSSPAPLTAGSMEALEELARVVGTQLEMRLEAARLGDSLLLRSDEIDLARSAIRHLQDVQRISGHGSWDYRIDRSGVQVTSGVRALLSLDPDQEVSEVGALLARVHPDDRDRVSRAHSDALTTGDRIDQRFRVLDADGSERWVDEEVLPHSDDAGRRVGLTGIVRDVTVERRRARTLRRAQDMAVLGRTAGAVAHDFNNLLTVILGESTLLEEALEEGENREAVGAILKAGERAAALTEQVLGYSRQHRDAPRALDPGAVLDGATALLRSTAPPEVSIRVEPMPEAWPVRADDSDLEASLLALGTRALESMEEAGGELLFAVANETVHEVIDTGRGRLRAGDYVRLTIRDSGTPVEDADGTDLFQPFLSGDRNQTPRIGLAVVSRFVDRCGGHLSVRPGRRGGTEICMRLPRAAAPDRARSSSTEGSPEMASGDARVLLVEDDPDLRVLTQRMLQSLGYRVTAVEDGPAALGVLRDGDRFDLLLTDLVLPGGMAGTAVAAEVLRTCEGIGVLYVSGYGDPGGDTRHACLSKPFSIRQLAGAVKRTLEAVPG
jgi:signal transduction histidine kinase/CheY-like chemotaxis protein